MPAEWLIDVSLTEHNQFVTLRKSMRMVRRASALHAYRVYLLNVFCNCHECRHRTEWFAHEVCVKTSNDDSDTSVCKCLYYFYNGLIEELSLIDSNNLYVSGNFKHTCR